MAYHGYWNSSTFVGAAAGGDDGYVAVAAAAANVVAAVVGPKIVHNLKHLSNCVFLKGCDAQM